LGFAHGQQPGNVAGRHALGLAARIGRPAGKFQIAQAGRAGGGRLTGYALIAFKSVRVNRPGMDFDII